MIEILAQTGTDLAIGFGGAMGGGGIIFWMVKRSIGRGLDHVDNSGIHIDPDDKPVSEEMCKFKHEALAELLVEKFSHQAETLKRIEGKIDGRGGGS